MSRGRSTASPNQKAMIARSLDVIERFTGKRPVGWLGPGLTETLETPDTCRRPASNISATGSMTTSRRRSTPRTAPLVTLPYTMELNDIPMMAVQHHESDYLSNAPSISSTGYTPKAKSAPRYSRSPSIPISAASRIGSNISKRSTTTCAGSTASLYWTGEEILEWYLKPGWVTRNETAVPDAVSAKRCAADRDRSNSAAITTRSAALTLRSGYSAPGKRE